MLYQQKETILANLKFKDENRTCGNRKYWFSYKDFLDPTDPFTDFSCENQEGKRKYIALIENLLERDETAKVFVEVYGLEEDDSGQFIYADTLILFSKLSLPVITQIFMEPEDVFPSDIREAAGFIQQSYIIAGNGGLIPVANLFMNGCSVYSCWWD